MRNPERWTAFHLSVLTFVVLAIVAALILEGLGFALIVALALVIILAIGYPLLVIMADGRERPPVRRRH
jgi:archaellum biogenesis protein FlaJ (TadC family)